eukprot:CAMPEP_0174938924 /NCGR_PEP_ID=MMETSP1355-20121228/65012_1 /TAXON_ID=464990 /ORGANISM="Hemiselmis tepida, Strain CCMP443" /LENGTH=128 /DNA_ID=CAMNT_0016185891 /DNA_START=141 /DNA_END=528 /DNA_ORIENTATION=-
MSLRSAAAAPRAPWGFPPSYHGETRPQGAEAPHGEAGAPRAKGDELALCVHGEGREHVGQQAGHGGVAGVAVLKLEGLEQRRRRPVRQGLVRRKHHLQLLGANHPERLQGDHFAEAAPHRLERGEHAF